MKNEQAKKATIQVHEIMIAYADKGPSGSWTDGYGGAAIGDFPEI